MPLHTRFVFVLICPSLEQLASLTTSGACMGALMSDDVFQDVAFKAQRGEHLLDGTDEFMHQVSQHITATLVTGYCAAAQLVGQDQAAGSARREGDQTKNTNIRR